MQPWIKKTLIGLFGASILVGGLTSCSGGHYNRHGGMDAESIAEVRGKMLERVLKLSTRMIIPVQPSMFDMLATRHFLQALLEEKSVRKGKIDVAVIGMRVDARTRAAGELEKFFATFDLPVLTYLRDTQVYVQTTAAGMTIFDLPPSRAERDLEQWRTIIDWVEEDGE